MGEPRSQWRLRSRRVIAETLARLSRFASTAEKKAALREAYPFGQRAMHPYKCWLAEVRLALEESPAPKVYGVRFRLEQTKVGGAPWLTLHCGLCDGKLPGGCLQCRRQRELFDRVIRSVEWQVFRRSAAAEPFVVAMMTDWLRERGCEPLEVCGG